MMSEPAVLTRAHVLAAQARIAGLVRRTPVLAPSGSERVWLKLELLQHTGVFKVRGALNLLLAAREQGRLTDAGVVIASGGNAGLATAYAAAALGVPATVVVPSLASPVKVARLRAYQARVVVAGTEYAHAALAAQDHALASGALLSHAYDLPEVVAGAGTVALELLEDAPVDTIVVAVGGGGLYAGLAAAVGDRARLVAVEPTLAPTLSAALAAGAPVDVPVSGVAADSLGARRVGSIAWATASADPPVSLLVEDEQINRARQALWDGWRITAEHGAAAAYAVVHSGLYRPRPDERVAVIVCGGNADPAGLA